MRTKCQHHIACLTARLVQFIELFNSSLVLWHEDTLPDWPGLGAGVSGIRILQPSLRGEPEPTAPAKEDEAASKVAAPPLSPLRGSAAVPAK